MKLKEINQKQTIRTFELDIPNATETLCVDIVDDGEKLEAWTYFEDHGIKNYYFGLPYKKNKHDLEEAMDIMKNDLEANYLNIYVINMKEDIISLDFLSFLEHLDCELKEKCEFLSKMEFEEFDGDGCDCPTCRYEKHKKTKKA